MPIYGKYFPEVVCVVRDHRRSFQIMKICSANKIPVTPRGAGTGLVGGCVPSGGGVINLHQAHEQDTGLRHEQPWSCISSPASCCRIWPRTLLITA